MEKTKCTKKNCGSEKTVKGVMEKLLQHHVIVVTLKHIIDRLRKAQKCMFETMFPLLNCDTFVRNMHNK